MRKTFDGTYYKHQLGGAVLSLIAGTSADEAFVQVITNRDSHYVKYPLPGCGAGETFRIGENSFSRNGVHLDIEEQGFSIRGDIKYGSLTPLRYDIMGPFRCLPMACRHKIVSLRHSVDGGLTVNGQAMDFTGGTGYIEGDSGGSFPKSYLWIQCNDFPRDACVTVSVADVPFAGLHFRGCIAVVYLDGMEYRLATYLGVRILVCNKSRVVLKQGRLRLEIDIHAGTGHKLLAPAKGAMVREIRERIACPARFRFLKGNELMFDESSQNASFEYVDT